MKMIKRITAALLGLLAASALAAAVSVWALPEEKDTLIILGGIRLTVRGAGAGLALLVLLSFANAWIGERKKHAEGHFPGTLLQGLGFGLLPALTVWKAFEHMTAAGAGAPLEERIPACPWLTEAGAYCPCRIELVLFFLAFAGEVIWLALRRREAPENGDLLPLSISLWGACRLMTERFRAGEGEGIRLMEILAAGALLLCLTLWVVRAFRQKKNTGYALACIPVMLVSLTIILLQASGHLRVNPAADLAIRCVSALLALKAAICMGRVTRKTLEISLP